MTTLADLGRMLIEVGENGRVLQFNKNGNSFPSWYDYDWNSVIQFDIERLEYRLKPKVTYYRVWRDGLGGLHIDDATKPFPELVGEIHNFEIEE